MNRLQFSEKRRSLPEQRAAYLAEQRELARIYAEYKQALRVLEDLFTAPDARQNRWLSSRVG